MAEKPEEKKLGPSVTYTNPDGGAKLVTVAGVLMKAGQSVNLVEKLGESGAAPILKKLSGNRYFKVDGGPDHSKEEEKGPVAAAGSVNDIAAGAVAEEARIRSTQGDEAADKYVESLDENGVPKEGSKDQPAQRKPKSGEPPEDVKTPESATLEKPARRREL